MLGIMKLYLRDGLYVEVTGGPYAKCPGTHLGVKMAVELPYPCDVSIPTKDFSVPDVDDLDAGLRHVVKNLLQGAPVYVGCLAGQGRTGLFMAILAKAFGEEEPVAYVREHYYPHAVETSEQAKFVEQYEIPFGVKMRILSMKVWVHWLQDGSLTTPSN